MSARAGAEGARQHNGQRPTPRARLSQSGRPETLYDILQVSPDASSEVIHASYRALARRYHPDVAGPDSVATMSRLSGAYAVLSDPSRRRRYDANLPRRHVRTPAQGCVEPTSASRVRQASGRLGLPTPVGRAARTAGSRALSSTLIILALVGVIVLATLLIFDVASDALDTNQHTTAPLGNLPPRAGPAPQLILNQP